MMDINRSVRPMKLLSGNISGRWSKFALLLIGLNSIIGFAKAQSYSIESFEGGRADINLYYKPASGILTISYLRDTLLIDDYMAIDTVRVLDKVFLQIDYAKRAGSNEDARNELILYVNNGKLCQALHVNSLTAYDRRPNEYLLFTVRTVFAGQDTDTYRLTLNIHTKKESARSPKASYEYNKTGFLAFDKKSKVFCSNYETVTGYYLFHEVNDKVSEKKYLKKNVPVIKIEKNKYYYVNGNWYTKRKNDFYSMLF